MADQHYMGLMVAVVVDTTASQSQLIPTSRQFYLRELTELSRIQSWLMTWFGIQYTPKTTSGFDQQLASISRLTGQTLDSQFMQYIITYDNQEITLGQQALTQAGHADLKTWASIIISDDQSEIRTMRAWQQPTGVTTGDH